MNVLYTMLYGQITSDSFLYNLNCQLFMVSENHCYNEKQSCCQGICSFLKESFKMDFDKYLFSLWDYHNVQK